MVNLSPGLTVGLTIGVIWSIIWKGLALWKAARQKDKVWFIVLLIVNTLGILEIIYIYLIDITFLKGTKNRNVNLPERT